MKTKDMIRDAEIYCSYLNDKSVLKSAKYRVEVNDEEILIRNEEKIGFLRVWVSRKLTNKYEFHMTSAVEYDEYHTQEFIKTLISYSKTPLEEREDEKHWSIHFGTGNLSYLNRDKGTGDLFMFDDVEKYDDQSRYQTKFTRSEIANYLKTDDEKIVDWFIERFGEEVTE